MNISIVIDEATNRVRVRDRAERFNRHRPNFRQGATHILNQFLSQIFNHNPAKAQSAAHEFFIKKTENLKLKIFNSKVVHELERLSLKK